MNRGATKQSGASRNRVDHGHMGDAVLKLATPFTRPDGRLSRPIGKWPGGSLPGLDHRRGCPLLGPTDADLWGAAYARPGACVRRCLDGEFGCEMAGLNFIPRALAVLHSVPLWIFIALAGAGYAVLFVPSFGGVDIAGLRREWGAWFWADAVTFTVFAFVCAGDLVIKELRSRARRWRKWAREQLLQRLRAVVRRSSEDTYHHRGPRA